MAGRAILAATDLSARCDRAVDRALQLSAELGLEAKAIHVTSVPCNTPEERSRVEAAIRSVLPDPALDIEMLAPCGPVPETIARTANEMDAALIATGLARYNDLSDYVLGTTVDKLVRHSRVPVLVVKRRPQALYGQILCATDLSEPSSHALRTALTLFPRHRIAAINAYRVGFEGWQKDAYVYNETQAEAEAKLARFLEGLPISRADRERVTARVRYGEVSDVMRAEEEREGADLVVLGTQGLGGFRQAAIGSTASSLLECLPSDTLIVPPPPPAH